MTPAPILHGKHDPHACPVCTARATHPGRLEISFFRAVEGTEAKDHGPCGIPRSSPACRSCSRQGCPLYLPLGDKSPLKGRMFEQRGLFHLQKAQSSPNFPCWFFALSCTMHLLGFLLAKKKKKNPNGLAVECQQKKTK